MSGWQVNLAIDLAKRCVEAGVRKDRESIRKAIYNLAEQEEAFLINFPEHRGDSVGYVRARDEYTKTGLGVIINLALKYWPEKVEQVSEKAPSPPKTVREVVLEESEVLFEIQLDQPYNPDEVSTLLFAYLSPRCPGTTFLQHSGSGTTLYVEMRTSCYFSQVAEELETVSWVVSVLSLPFSRRSRLLTSRS